MGSSLQTTEGSTSETSDRVLFRAEFEVTRHYSKKNAKTIGYRRTKSGRTAPFIMARKSIKSSEREFLLLLLQNGVPGVRVDLPITSMAVSGMFVIESPNFITKKDHRVNLKGGDLDNIVTSYLDALIKAGVLSDDALITSITAVKKPGPKNKIQLWLFQDENFQKQAP